jgi:hypothetical protein
MDVRGLGPSVPALRRHDLAEFVDHRVVHFAIEQQFAGVGDQSLGPKCDDDWADDAHGQVQPRPAPEQTSEERGDCHDRSRSVCNDMHIGRLQVQVMVTSVVPRLHQLRADR